MRKLLVLMVLSSLIFAQTYMAGDIVSEAHQNQEFTVCYGEYENETFTLADLNGAVNGGDYHIIFIDMAATW